MRGPCSRSSAGIDLAFEISGLGSIVPPANPMPSSVPLLRRLAGPIFAVLALLSALDGFAAWRVPWSNDCAGFSQTHPCRNGSPALAVLSLDDDDDELRHGRPSGSTGCALIAWRTSLLQPRPI